MDCEVDRVAIGLARKALAELKEHAGIPNTIGKFWAYLEENADG